MTVQVRFHVGHIDHMPRCVVTRRAVEFCSHCRNAGDNSARHIPERLEALAHCDECNLWLRPSDSCIHIPAAPTPACGSCGGGRNAAPVALVPPHSDEGISA